RAVASGSSVHLYHGTYRLRPTCSAWDGNRLRARRQLIAFDQSMKVVAAAVCSRTLFEVPAANRFGEHTDSRNPRRVGPRAAPSPSTRHILCFADVTLQRFTWLKPLTSPLPARPASLIH